MRKFTQRGLSWQRLAALTIAVAAASGAATATASTGGQAPPSLGGRSTMASLATAPAYRVVQEGLTPADGARLAEGLGIGNALLPNGAFAYVDSSRFGQVPTNRVKQGKDESGNPTVSEALDMKALAAIKPIPDSAALSRAGKFLGLAGLSPDFKARPTISHTQIAITDKRGTVTQKRSLDTAVSYQLTLGGLPVTGQGAKLRITYAADGAVSQLSDSMRKVERSGTVAIIAQGAAATGCSKLYGPGVKQNAPTLGYYLPELSADRASGQGGVKQILPAYTCNPVGGKGPQAHRLLQAVPGSSPQAKVTATKDGASVSASASVDGGTSPYAYRWSSSTTTLTPPAGTASSVKYAIQQPRAKATETVSLEVTDANGLSATVAVQLPANGTKTGQSVPGGGGFGALAIGPTDVGIENMVEEWQCAQDSANGFKSVMASHGINAAFDWRGPNAWEKDFKKGSLGGLDSTYVDNVDAQWYTGHGWPGGFTFDTNHDDTSIVPSDAQWGNGDLEWMQLESCEVLRDTNGTNDYFGRWGPTMDGLHMLNGFHTSAYCVGGGTGADFAQYLFPQTFLWWVIRPALTVRQAWANMALDKEPSGVVYRSMGPIGPGGVTNIGDHFWGQGSVGPDISAASHIGYWSITGTV